MNDSVFHNDKCNNKFFITSLLSQLNALQTLPSSISATMKGSEKYVVQYTCVV